jgi:glycine cleavage system H lipoate-binding protein
MPNEVKILWGRMSDKTWHDFELKVARYLDDGWVVIGFTAARAQEHGDIVYVMLQRD